MCYVPEMNLIFNMWDSTQVVNYFSDISNNTEHKVMGKI